MLSYLVLLLCLSTLTSGIPRQENSKKSENESEQLLYAAQKLANPLAVSQQQQQQQAQQEESEKQQQDTPQVIPEQQHTIVPEIPYGLPYLEQQFQYPGFNFLQEKQLFSRVQPQIVFYGPGGHGQPILINPGSPPGNFLVPHQPQPGPNVIIRDAPQRPVFVAGYPKPAHIPPIEKDAEEIPTNPARIPPLAPSPAARKPEKLETFNEDKAEYPKKFAGEADVLAAADRYPQLIPGTNLKPGHRFFILNGEDLFTNYALRINPEVNLKYAESEQELLPTYQQPQLRQEKDSDLNAVPIPTLLLRNAVTGQISSAQDFSEQGKYPENLISLNQPTQQAFFRSSLPLDISVDSENIQPIGEFRFAPPSEPYFSLDGDIENDAVVIDAKTDGDDSSNSADSSTETTTSPQTSAEPSMAQAAPGAIALAGPGGVAGAAPRGTALVGKGGLAVASPQATAVAGPSKNEDDKNSTRKTK